jgi:predicted HTH transcriptional regulator
MARPQKSPSSLSKGHIKDIKNVKDTGASGRRDSIVEIIQAKGGSANIKDISTVIRGVSEKTVQRELAALIESGVLRKEGERRWSTYYIV